MARIKNSGNKRITLLTQPTTKNEKKQTTRENKKSTKKEPKIKPLIGGSIKKPHRFRPGTVALRDIRKYVQGTEDLIKEAPFQRTVREIASNLPYNAFLKENSGERNSQIRFKPSAIAALKAASQDHIIRLFKKSNLAAIHAHRTTIYPKDMRFWTEDNNLNRTDYPERTIEPKKRINKKKKKEGGKKEKEEVTILDKHEHETKITENKPTKDIQNNDINNNDIHLNFKNFI